MHNWLIGSIDVIALKEPLWSIVSIISELHSPQVLTHSAFKESEKTKSKQEIRQKGHNFIETFHLLCEEVKHIKHSPSHSWMTYFISLYPLQALNCVNSDAERRRQKSKVIYSWKRQSLWGMRQGVEWNSLPSSDKLLGKGKRNKKRRTGIRSLKSWTVLCTLKDILPFFLSRKTFCDLQLPVSHAHHWKSLHSSRNYGKC